MRFPSLALLWSCTPVIPASNIEPDPVEPAPSTTDTSDTGSPDTHENTDVQAEPHAEVHCILEVRWDRISSADQTWVEFEFEAQDTLTSPSQSAEAGAHSALLLGTPCETEVQFSIVTLEGDETRRSIEYSAWTGSTPWSLPDAEVLTWNPSLATSDRWVLGSLDVSQSSWYGGPFTVFIMDRQGRIVWYYEVPDSRLALQAQVAWDGSHIVLEGSTNYVWDNDVDPTVTRLSLDYSTIDITELPQLGFTLDEIENGTLLYEGNSDSRTLIERQSDGTERVIWECDPWMSSAGLPDYYCAPNTIIWVPSTDTVLWSMYYSDTVVELDRKTGELLRQWGQIESSWEMDPPGSMIDYQHYPNYTQAGTLLVSTHTLGEKYQQMAREFMVDDQNQTLTEIWSFGEDSPYYATYGGEATRHGPNTLISYGTDGALMEVTTDKEVAWEVRWRSGSHAHLLGHLTLIDDLYALNLGPQ